MIVTLCSGGLDSVTLAYYIAKMWKEDQVLLNVNYGQRHSKEAGYAALCAKDLGVDLLRVSIDGPIFKSALTGIGDIPQVKYTEESLAVTVVPNRNAVLAMLAVSAAVSVGADGVALAVHAGDHAVYKDCRPEFIWGLNDFLPNAVDIPIFVNAPFLSYTKTKIAKLSYGLGVIPSETWSCYLGGPIHCGVCSTCRERRKAFLEAGVPDDTEYAR